jgi:hypothetical protein
LRVRQYDNRVSDGLSDAKVSSASLNRASLSSASLARASLARANLARLRPSIVSIRGAAIGRVGCKRIGCRRVGRKRSIANMSRNRTRIRPWLLGQQPGVVTGAAIQDVAPRRKKQERGGCEASQVSGRSAIHGGDYAHPDAR